MVNLIIFVHELGHLMVAKFFHIKVPQFSVGMGKKLFSFTYKKTEFCFRLLPIGGFVLVSGMVPFLQNKQRVYVVINEDGEITILGKKIGLSKRKIRFRTLFVETFDDLGIFDVNGYYYPFSREAQILSPYGMLPIEKEKSSLWSKPVYAQFLVFVAGVLFNVVFSFFIFFIANVMTGHDIIQSLENGVVYNWIVLQDSITSIGSLFTAHVLNQVSGVVMVGSVVVGTVQGSIGHYDIHSWLHRVITLFVLTGFFSTSIGLMNLIPFPPLDGFHCVRVFIEKKIRISIRVWNIIALTGMMILLVFSVLVNLHDIFRLLH